MWRERKYFFSFFFFKGEKRKKSKLDALKRILKLVG